MSKFVLVLDWGRPNYRKYDHLPTVQKFTSISAPRVNGARRTRIRSPIGLVHIGLERKRHAKSRTNFLGWCVVVLVVRSNLLQSLHTIPGQLRVYRAPRAAAMPPRGADGITRCTGTRVDFLASGAAAPRRIDPAPGRFLARFGCLFGGPKLTQPNINFYLWFLAPS